jgi:hypothetical protein
MQTHTYALDTTWRTLLRDLGVVPANVLRRAGLAEDLFQQPSARLVPEDYHRLWNGIEAETKDPAFPVRLCEAVRVESFSPPLFAALCSPNFVVAAQRISQYKKLVAPFRFDVVETDRAVAVELSWLDAPSPPPASLVMMELLFCVTLMRVGTRELVRPVEVTTTVLPEALAPYEDFLGVPLRTRSCRSSRRMSRCGPLSNPNCADAWPISMRPQRPSSVFVLHCWRRCRAALPRSTPSRES